MPDLQKQTGIPTSIGIVIPAHNEEARIGNTLDNYLQYYDKLWVSRQIASYRIAVVINNTRDGTERIVREKQKDNSRLDCLTFLPGGKGFAVMQGFKFYLREQPGLELLGFTDADGSTPAEELFKISTFIDGYDGVIGSRYLKDSVVEPPRPFERKIASRAFNLWERVLLGMPYHDTQCGAKIFKSSCLKDVVNSLRTGRWAFDVELLYDLRKKGYKILEVPIKWHDESGSQFKLVSSGTNAALDVLKIRLNNLRRK